MKQAFYLAILLAVNFSVYSQNGTIVSYEIIEQNTLQENETLVADAGIPPGILVPKFGTDIYKIVYNTIDAHGQSTIASGALALPVGSLCKAPMAIYCHGTTSKRTGVPSHLSQEAAIGNLLSSKGVAVAMPDYLGLGDSPGFHPYVHSASEATASIDMLKASRALCDTLGVGYNQQIFTFGYSQGGHAAMATHKAIQELGDPDIEVTASAPMSGPYDVSGAQEQYMIGFDPYATPGYLPYILFAYQDVYQNLYTDLSDVMESPYDSILPPLFDGETGMGFINSQCDPVPRNMMKDSVITAYENDPQHPLRLALQDNDLIDWLPEAPIRMLYCGMDEQVTGENAVNAQASFEALGATNTEAINVGSTLDHTGCVSFALLNGLGFFDQYTDYFNSMEVSATVVDASDGTTTDGEIQLTVESGNPITFNWSNGASGSSLTGVTAGDYTVSMTDNSGCETEQAFSVYTTTSLNEAMLEGIKVAYDRGSKILRVEMPFSSEAQLSLVDLNGRTIMAKTFSGSTQLYLNEISAGSYIVSISTKYGVAGRRIVN